MSKSIYWYLYQDNISIFKCYCYQIILVLCYFLTKIHFNMILPLSHISCYIKQMKYIYANVITIMGQDNSTYGILYAVLADIHDIWAYKKSALFQQGVLRKLFLLTVTKAKYCFMKEESSYMVLSPLTLWFFWYFSFSPLPYVICCV